MVEVVSEAERALDSTTCDSFDDDFLDCVDVEESGEGEEDLDEEDDDEFYDAEGDLDDEDLGEGWRLLARGLVKQWKELRNEAVTRTFSASSDPGLDVLRVGVYTIAGRHLLEAELDSANTVRDLKREVRLATGLLSFKLVCGTEILEEDDTLEKAGLCENPAVQLVALPTERFAAQGSSNTVGLYLLHDGVAKAFCCTTRIINRREDEEHFQRTLRGRWTSTGDVVTVVFTDFESNVFNEAAIAPWTSRDGWKPLPRHGLLNILREEGGARLLDGAALTIPDGFWLPETLDRLAPDEVCMFDAWHLAGTSTVP